MDKIMVARELVKIAKNMEATDASKEFKDAVKECRKMIVMIEKGLDAKEKRQSKEPENWGYVGDIGNVLTMLNDIHGFLYSTGGF